MQFNCEFAEIFGDFNSSLIIFAISFNSSNANMHTKLLLLAGPEKNILVNIPVNIQTFQAIGE